jgi:hypothetical protein
VVDKDSSPVAGVTLAVLSAEGPVPELAYVTGADGSVQIGLPPGAALLETTDAQGARRRFSIEATATAGHSHDLHLEGDAT